MGQSALQRNFAGGQSLHIPNIKDPKINGQNFCNSPRVGVLMDNFPGWFNAITMRVVLLIWLTIFSASVLWPTVSHAQSTIQLFDEDAKVNLTDNFALYYEDDEPLTIDQILERQQSFQWFMGGNPNFGFRDNGLWLTNKLSNVSNLQSWVFNIEFSQLDKVDFYLVSDGVLLLESHQGKLQSEQLFRNPTLRADLPIATPIELFIRVQSSSSSLIVPLTVAPEPVHSLSVQIDSTMWGLFYGGLFILAVYNLVIFFSAKEVSLLAYVGYIAAVVMWQFVWGGHLQVVNGGESPVWIMHHTELLFVINGLMAGLFTLYFLETRINAPTAHPVVVSLLVIQILLGLICITGILPTILKHNLVYGVGIASVCSYLYAGFEALSNRFQPARYFTFAWTVLALSAVVGILSLTGLLPSTKFTTYCFQVGVFLEAALFSLALMEKNRSKLEAEVDQATDDLRNNMELIEEQNARLDIARKDAIKASNVKSQFLANMSHEIRTPLNAILGFSRELGNATLPADQQEQVRIVNTAADNLLSIVNDVLDFSKIEAGKLQISNQPFEPNQLLEEMVTIMSKSAHSKRLEFVFDLGPLPEKLIGDLFRIKQILNNLLSNALKFTSTGTITLGVKGCALPHGNHELTFTIEDTGIGISRQDRKKLFSAFSQVDDALNRSYQGTGLGLVICRELVRLMSGRMDLRSEPGLGSTFIITLHTNRLSKKSTLKPSADWLNKHVVIFDPIPQTRHASAQMLTALGAKVHCVETIAFLHTLEVKPDFLFATVPGSMLVARDALLGNLIQFKAGKRILWYSGPEPFNQYPSLTQHFDTQVRMPLTLSKLDDLQHRKINQVKNPMQHKLNRLPGIRILAVDDMEMNLKLLTTWLADSPIELTTSMSGQDAVNRCQSIEYDMILMDVQMPGMDGLQASRAIRKTPLNLGTPIIAVTAHAFKEEQERLLASGMDDYLPKPMEISGLLDLIRRWCQTQNAPEINTTTLDWELATRRTNHNKETARELLTDFLRLLPESVQHIEAAWEERDYDTLQRHVHRIHGACCYTGVPALQRITDQLESALKRQQYMLVAELVTAFLAEARNVQAQGSELLVEPGS